MSEQYNINVQPVLNTDALYEQLNNQKYKLNVEVDGAALSSQLQSAVNSVTSGAAPAKVPVEFDVDSLIKGMNVINTTTTAFENIQKGAALAKRNLDSLNKHVLAATGNDIASSMGDFTKISTTAIVQVCSNKESITAYKFGTFICTSKD